MKNETIKTCEEYVLNDLFKAKEELEKATNTIKSLQSINKLVDDNNKKLTDLLVKAFGNAEIEKTEYTTTVKVNGRFVGLYSNDSTNEEDEVLKALVELIQFAQATPTKE